MRKDQRDTSRLTKMADVSTGKTLDQLCGSFRAEYKNSSHVSMRIIRPVDLRHGSTPCERWPTQLHNLLSATHQEVLD